MNALSTTVIGVDPAFRKGGFWTAVYEPLKTAVTFVPYPTVLEFHDYINRIPTSGSSPFFAVENSNIDAFLFYTHKSHGGALLTAGQARKVRGAKLLTKAEIATIGRNVGANQAVSELTCRSIIQRFGAERLLALSPKQKGRKYTEMEFNYIYRNLDKVTLYGYKGGNDGQDQRDAYKLAMQGYDHLKLLQKLNQWKP